MSNHDSHQSNEPPSEENDEFRNNISESLPPISNNSESLPSSNISEILPSSNISEILPSSNISESLPSRNLCNLHFTQLMSNTLAMIHVPHWYQISRNAALRVGEGIIDILQLFRDSYTNVRLVECPVCLAGRAASLVISENIPENDWENLSYVPAVPEYRQQESVRSDEEAEMPSLNSEELNSNLEVNTEPITEETYAENTTEETYPENITSEEPYTDNITEETSADNITEETYADNTTEETYTENITDETFAEDITDETYANNIPEETHNPILAEETVKSIQSKKKTTRKRKAVNDTPREKPKPAKRKNKKDTVPKSTTRKSSKKEPAKKPRKPKKF